MRYKIQKILTVITTEAPTVGKTFLFNEMPAFTVAVQAQGEPVLSLVPVQVDAGPSATVVHVASAPPAQVPTSIVTAAMVGTAYHIYAAFCVLNPVLLTYTVFLGPLPGGTIKLIDQTLFPNATISDCSHTYSPSPTSTLMLEMDSNFST